MFKRALQFLAKLASSGGSPPIDENQIIMAECSVMINGRVFQTPADVHAAWRELSMNDIDLLASQGHQVFGTLVEFQGLRLGPGWTFVTERKSAWSLKVVRITKDGVTLGFNAFNGVSQHHFRTGRCLRYTQMGMNSDDALWYHQLPGKRKLELAPLVAEAIQKGMMPKIAQTKDAGEASKYFKANLYDNRLDQLREYARLYVSR